MVGHGHTHLVRSLVEEKGCGYWKRGVGKWRCDEGLHGRCEGQGVGSERRMLSKPPRQSDHCMASPH